MINKRKDLYVTKSEEKALKIITDYLNNHGFNWEIYRTPKEIDLDLLNYKTTYLGNHCNCMRYMEFIKACQVVFEKKTEIKERKERELLEKVISNENI